MAIAYKSAGAGTATETSGAALSPACPATVDAGDILIAHVFWEGTTTAPSTPSGWDLLHGPEVIQTSIARHWVFGRIADGSEDGATVAFGSPAVTTQRGARIYSFSGRVGGTITQLVTGFSATSHATDPQMPTVTTVQAGALAVALVGQNDNNTVGNATGESGGNWTEAVAEYRAALTPGLMLQLQTATPDADPGTISGGSASTTNDPVGVIGCQIQALYGTGDVLIRVGSTATVVSPEFTEDVDPDHTETPDGFGTTAGLGTPVVAVTVAPEGYGTTSSLGTPLETVTALPTGYGTTSGLGTPALQADSTVEPSGQEATSALGEPTADAVTLVEPTGLEATAGLGTPSLTADSVVAPSGFEGTSELGTPSAFGGASVSPDGFGTTADLGTPGVTADSVVAPAGQEVMAELGTPAVDAGAVTEPSGQEVTASLGTPVVLNDYTVTPDGFGLTADLGTPTVDNGAAPPAPPAPAGSPIPTRWQRRPMRWSAVPEDPAAPKQDATVAVSGFALQARVGTTWQVVDAAVVPLGLATSAGLGAPLVTGMHNPTDEQVVEWLLAALAESV